MSMQLDSVVAGSLVLPDPTHFGKVDFFDATINLRQYDGSSNVKTVDPADEVARCDIGWDCLDQTDYDNLVQFMLDNEGGAITVTPQGGKVVDGVVPGFFPLGEDEENPGCWQIGFYLLLGTGSVPVSISGDLLLEDGTPLLLEDGTSLKLEG